MTTHILPDEQFKQLLSRVPEPEPSTALDSPILKLLASTGPDSRARLMSEQHYVAGAVVFGENEPGDAMYIVRSGRVLVIKGSFKAPKILSCLGVGTIFGEMALLEDRPRSASVIAIDELRLLKISRENFQQMLTSDPTFGISMLRALSMRLRAANEAQRVDSLTETRLGRQVSKLQTEKEQLVDLQQRYQTTIDLIVHDLRNPLSLILTASNVLEMVLPKEVLQANQELLELINANCEYMQRLISSLLDVSQMEESEAELLLTRTDLPDLIQSTLDRMAIFLNRGDIDFRVDIPPALPLIALDEEKISRVLANLIDNAVKYTLPGGHITVAANQQNGEILVSVTNTGHSISAEDRKHIFDRFAQADKEKTKSSGFGLGLAFCRMTVEAHGGRIWLEPSDEGQGNRFVFSLPLAVEQAVTPLAA